MKFSRLLLHENTLESNWKPVYLIGPFYAGPNLTPAPFTPALITPEANFSLTPIRAAYYAKENAALIGVICGPYWRKAKRAAYYAKENGWRKKACFSANFCTKQLK